MQFMLQSLFTQLLVLYLLLACVLPVLTGKSIDLVSRSNLSRETYWKIGCPGSGPFTTLSDCYVVCDDNNCTNAKQLCINSRISCNALIRSPKGLGEPLKGQLVELVSLNLTEFKNEAAQHRNICLEYGKRLSNTALANELRDYKKMYGEPIQRFVSGNGTLLFLHLRKTGGI